MKTLTLSKLTEEILKEFGLPKEEVNRIKKSISAIASRGEVPFEVVKSEEGLHIIPCTEENVGKLCGYLVERYYPCKDAEVKQRITVSSELEKALFGKYEEAMERIIKLTEELRKAKDEAERFKEENESLNSELFKLQKRLQESEKRIQNLGKELKACKVKLRKEELKKELLEKFKDSKIVEEVERIFEKFFA